VFFKRPALGRVFVFDNAGNNTTHRLNILLVGISYFEVGAVVRRDPLKKRGDLLLGEASLMNK